MGDSGKKTIIVTGASSGIGREIALQLALPNRLIWLIGRDEERLNKIADEVRNRGAEAKPIILDLYDLEAVDRFLEEQFTPEVRVDWVYLGAAITAFGEVQNMRQEDWDSLYRVNLLSPIQFACHFYRGMVERKCGNIVFISSLAAYAGYPTATAYATMKAGLLGLQRSLFYEGLEHGVSISHISLGYVKTGIYRSAIYRNTTYERTMELIGQLGFKVISPAEAANGIIRGVNRGKSDFALPFYATATKWVAPRFPKAISLLHKRIIKIFHKLQ
jgi:short-subunit dehydrogenase